MITSATALVAISTLGMSPYLRSFYASGLLSELTPNLVFRQDANVSSIPKGNAPVMIQRRPRKLVVNDPASYRLAEGIAPASMSRQMDSVTTNVYQFGGWIGTTDFLQAVSVDPEVYQNQKALGFFTSEVMDCNLRDKLASDVTQVIYAGGVTARSSITSAMVLTDTELKKASALLTHNAVPRFSDGRYHGIYPALAQYDLMGTDGYKYPSWYQNKNDLEAGMVRDLYGISPKWSQLVTRYPGAGASSIDVYRGYVYGQEAFGVADLASMGIESPMVMAGQASQSDPLGQRGSQGSKWTDGVALLDARRIVALEFALGYAG
jgi:N4-gp56 family major capsid protein